MSCNAVTRETETRHQSGDKVNLGDCESRVFRLGAERSCFAGQREFGESSLDREAIDCVIE